MAGDERFNSSKHRLIKMPLPYNTVPIAPSAIHTRFNNCSRNSRVLTWVTGGGVAIILRLAARTVVSGPPALADPAHLSATQQARVAFPVINEARKHFGFTKLSRA